MMTTRRALLVAPLALCAAGGFVGAAFSRNAAGFALIEDGAGPAARGQLAALARQWPVSETIRLPARGFIDLRDLRRRLERPGTVRMVALVRPSNHLLCCEAVRAARAAILFDEPAQGSESFGVLAAQTA